MQANVGRETSPEAILRRALADSGFSFEIDSPPEAGTRWRVDFVFREARVCVFTDGCFWHRCPKHYCPPKSNVAWWEEKIAATVQRDQRQARFFRRRGWAVLRFWEHDLKQRLPYVLSRISKALVS